jgi:hypothetical protein
MRGFPGRRVSGSSSAADHPPRHVVAAAAAFSFDYRLADRDRFGGIDLDRAGEAAGVASVAADGGRMRACRPTERDVPF